jgi:dynein heavy chain
VALQNLWCAPRFAELLLIDVPPKPATIIDLKRFMANELQVLEAGTAVLHGEWIPETVKLTVDGNIYPKDSQSEATYFEQISALLSAHLRLCVETSLKAYRDFFRRFASEPPSVETCMQLKDSDERPDCFLTNRLVSRDGAVVFRHPIGKVLDHILKVYQDVLGACKELPRPDAKLGGSPHRTSLYAVGDDEQHVQRWHGEIEQIVMRNLQAADQVRELYKPYQFLLTEDARAEEFAEDTTKTIEDYRAYLTNLRDKMREISETFPIRIRMQLLEVDLQEVNTQLVSAAQSCVAIVLARFAERQRENFRMLKNSLIASFDKLSSKLHTEEELAGREQELDTFREVEVTQRLDEYEEMLRWQNLQFELEHEMVHEDLQPAQDASERVRSIAGFLKDRDDAIKMVRNGIEVDFCTRRAAFQDDLQKYAEQVSKFKKLGNIKQVDDYVERIETLKEQFARAEAEVEDITSKERVLGWEPTEFDELEKSVNELEPYEKLWTLVAEAQKNLQTWTKGPLFTLDPEEVEGKATSLWRDSFRLQTGFETAEPEKLDVPASVALKVKAELDDFRKHVPLIQALCNPGMRARHWEQVSKIVTYTIEPDSSFTLMRIVDMDVGRYLDELGDISEAASKEYQIEKTLDVQLSEWEPLVCEFKPWKDTGTYILAGGTVDEVQTLLDDHVIKTQTMKGSPFAKIFVDRIGEWEAFLMGSQSVIDVWLKVQSVWLYLEPIFASEDIMKQMPREGQLFREVDKAWKRLINKFYDDPKGLTVFREPGLLETLNEAHEKLEIVQKGLNDYLEMKRLKFPRFFFLSNDNLLEILSETKDPTRVQPHLAKCFEGLKEARFTDDLQINGLVSPEKEVVPLDKNVDPARARGNVEEWLVWLEAAMVQSIRSVTFNSTEAYTQSDYVDWIQVWPGQVCICAGNLWWTRECEEAFDTGGNAAIREYGNAMTHLLKRIVDLVRQDIPKLVRQTCEALIVIFVHNKDTVVMLGEMGIDSSKDFDWQVQLRYTIEDNTDKDPVEKDFFCRISNSVLKYEYEYLGNSSRLIITPLTDRCYRTCVGALHLGYGAAPEGPAGTGKTETTKDLAKAIAMFCVVFNCSDGLDFLAMAKFFKGLAATGGWACFDEFNRINVEVLSVVAQQILHIQNSIKARLTEFEFEGTWLPLKWSCNAFITMNPGYAGRAELPDNLKALFRTVAMMVPDYAMIAEIKLYAYGFEDARSLAMKIVTTYKLCSEQLSSQGHYDYGMRAVFSVLVAAGNLKRAYGQEDESVLMLRAINEVNVAKFLAFDVPLFRGITSDLFPGVALPVPDYSLLVGKMKEYMDSKSLTAHEYYLEKIIQFYETHLVRHSLMLIGLPFSGKTTALRTAKFALTELAKAGTFNPGDIVHEQRLNAKSVNARELYGCFDEVSHEWTDGIVAVLFRDLSRNQTTERKWLVFDGPIDAIWIEDMNTVMDDNKKLCLTSGEIIAMSPNMRIVLESMDVEVASPATISRNGMVYFEPHLMGYQHLIDKVFGTCLPTTFQDPERAEVASMTRWLIPAMLDYYRKDLKEVSPMQDQHLVYNYCIILSSVMAPYNDQELYSSTDSKAMIQVIDAYCLLSLIWVIGGSVTTESRIKFDAYLRKILAGTVDGITSFKKVAPQIPERGTVYDYTFLREGVSWKNWMDIIEVQTSWPATTTPESVVVQTQDFVRYSYWISHCIKHRFHLLFCGPTGTGKTVYMQGKLLELPKEEYTQIFIGFSAKSRCDQVQDLVDSKLDRRRKGVYGPPFGKYCFVMVDDLNMPMKEKYGAQPPIEILRQMIDGEAYNPSGGWFDRKDSVHPFKSIIDLKLFAAMGTPGGGRTFITPRFIGHTFLLGFALLDDDNMCRIFQTILDWRFLVDAYPSDIQGMARKLVTGTLEVYKQVLANMLPTPLKVHYTFNLRDFAKVVFGVLMVQAKDCDGTGRHARLWIHEVTRVFADRLVVQEDRQWMLGTLKEVTQKAFGSKLEDLCKHLDNDGDHKCTTLDEARGLFFGDMMSPAAAPKRPYAECSSLEELQQKVEEHLEQYNIMGTKRMDLVMFLYAIEHLSRVARVVRTGGNVLLVGVGGSGRQSCTRLAAFMSDYNVFQIEIAKGYGMVAFRDDLRKLLTNAGGKGEKSVFLFTDSQIKEEGFVEDINNLLNTGEVPNLFPPELIVEITELVRAPARQEGKAPDGTLMQLFGYFVERCKRFLSISLAFSPIGDAWRARLRMFPSLVNCCTIDWFTEWPADALQNVAQRFLADVEMDDAQKAACVKMCQFFHSDTTELAAKMMSALRRPYYVTPTAFLELIQTFKTLLAKKRKEVGDLKFKYENGLEKLTTTEGAVASMQEELIALQPQLVKKNGEVGEMKVVAGAEKEKVEVVVAAVGEDKAKADQAAAEARHMKEDCEADLAEAMPALEAAMAALNTLTQKDISEVKAMKSPPQPVRLVMQAVCILKGIKPVKAKDKDTGAAFDDYWPASMKMVGESGFLKSLQEFDKDNMATPIVKKIAALLPHEDMQPERVQKVSSACFGIVQWVRAMETYDRVAKVVGPKKEELKEAEAGLAVVMEKLAVKEAALKEVQDKLDALLNQLAGLEAEQENLAYQVDLCEKKLTRAEQLIESLGGEKIRWTENAHQLGFDLENLTGDVVVASGLIAYLGVFTPDYRSGAVEQWTRQTKEFELPGSEVMSLEKCLGEPVKIRSWVIAGLPNDAFSIENGIIVDNSRRWPLAIDPQGQANKWIRKMEAPNKITTCKFTEADYLRRMEGAIQFGYPFLIENVFEEMDPAIEPVLLKQVFKKGGAMMIKLGETLVEYSKNFRFYLTTKLRNPHYLPEVVVKVTLLNFMITQVGLQDQLLNIVVEKERPDLAEEKVRIVLESAENKKQLADVENKILQVLSSSQGNILEDEYAIKILGDSKIISNDVAAKQEAAEVMEVEIDEARQGYLPVAFQGAVLFFVVADMGSIDPMYQYSLPFFVGLFIMSIAKSEPNPDLALRIDIMNDAFAIMLYNNICRSLFEKHKLLFSFAMYAKLEIAYERMPMDEYRFLLTGGVSMQDPPAKPVEWVPVRCWAELFKLNLVGGVFDKIHENFAKDLTSWKSLYDEFDPMPIMSDEERQPAALKGLNDFQLLIFLRCFRPDRVVPGIIGLVGKVMGKEFVSPPPFDLPASYGDSLNITPLLFIISPGSDPTASLQKFALVKGKEVSSISLGQGQGPKAEAMITNGTSNGGWVLLNNCHLAVSWMGNLERICEGFDKTVHRDFRLWLTSYPSKDFPVSVLQNGVKMTNEPPKGLRANLLGSFLMDPTCREEFFDGCVQKETMKRLLTGLCFFHAVIQERKLYGPLGWNIPYEFTENDMRISVMQLNMFLNEYPDELPLKALSYMAGECNYGGRVTDDKDRRLCVTLLAVYYSEACANDATYRFAAECEEYYAPGSRQPGATYEDHLEYIRNLPAVTPPAVFGFNNNAAITKEQGETYAMTADLLLTAGQASGGGGASAEDVVGEVANDVTTRVRQVYDIAEVQKKYPIKYEESMNTVVAQELTRYNRLLSTIHSSLSDIKKAIKGLLLMSPDLEAAFFSIFDGQVPEIWKAKSYNTLKPLGSYVTDLLDRIKFYDTWLANGIPVNFWFSGIFFTQAFTTGAMQNFARRYTIPIDTLDFDFAFPKDQNPTERPDNGVWTYGLFFEAARWDDETWQIEESYPKILFEKMPMFHLIPIEKAKIELFPHYNCPCYKVSSRRGVLATTGHSSNFVMYIRCNSDQPQPHWIKRGVALLTQLDI